MQIRLAVETLLPITKRISLVVPAADFPTWADAINSVYIRCQQHPDTWMLHTFAINGQQHVSIDASIDGPVPGVQLDETDSGIKFGEVTRDQLDYLTEEA